jgi:hypothetical protein
MKTTDEKADTGPTDSLWLHLHQVVKGTFTLELSNVLGTQNKGPTQTGANP